MSVSVREARPEDAARIAELHVEGWQEYRSFVPLELTAARTVASRTGEGSEFLAGERTGHLDGRRADPGLRGLLEA